MQINKPPPGRSKEFFYSVRVISEKVTLYSWIKEAAEDLRSVAETVRKGKCGYYKKRNSYAGHFENAAQLVESSGGLAAKKYLFSIDRNDNNYTGLPRNIAVNIIKRHFGNVPSRETEHPKIKKAYDLIEPHTRTNWLVICEKHATAKALEEFLAPLIQINPNISVRPIYGEDGKVAMHPNNAGIHETVLLFNPSKKSEYLARCAWAKKIISLDMQRHLEFADQLLF